MGSLAAGAFYLQTRNGTDRVDDHDDNGPETPGFSENQTEPEAPDDPQEEPQEEPEQPEAPCDVRVEGLHLSGESFYAGEPVEARRARSPTSPPMTTTGSGPRPGSGTSPTSSQTDSPASSPLRPAP